MLEVISRGSGSQAHPVPLLFVHGGWHAAWCWEENFLGFFANRGYRAVAVSLRNHGNSDSKNPRRRSVADWVNDIASVASTFTADPVVIGHSMGGFVVQKYLEKHKAPAGVLLASMPPSGARRVTLRILRRHPVRAARALSRGKTRRALNTPAAARQSFYSAATPEADVARYTALLDEEHVGRYAMDLTMLNLPKPERVTAPLLVLAPTRTPASPETKSEAQQAHTEQKPCFFLTWATT